MLSLDYNAGSELVHLWFMFPTRKKIPAITAGGHTRITTTTQVLTSQSWPKCHCPCKDQTRNHHDPEGAECVPHTRTNQSHTTLAARKTRMDLSARCCMVWLYRWTTQDCIACMTNPTSLLCLQISCMDTATSTFL